MYIHIEQSQIQQKLIKKENKMKHYIKSLNFVLYKHCALI